MERVCYNENNRKQGIPAEIFNIGGKTWRHKTRQHLYPGPGQMKKQ